MTVLKFVDTSGNPLGVISWFAVHATSMNNSNKLVSGDNKGYASLLFEQSINGGTLHGKVGSCFRNIFFLSRHKKEMFVINNMQHVGSFRGYFCSIE